MSAVTWKLWTRSVPVETRVPRTCAAAADPTPIPLRHRPRALLPFLQRQTTVFVPFVSQLKSLHISRGKAFCEYQGKEKQATELYQDGNGHGEHCACYRRSAEFSGGSSKLLFGGTGNMKTFFAVVATRNAFFPGKLSNVVWYRNNV